MVGIDFKDTVQPVTFDLWFVIFYIASPLLDTNWFQV